MVERAGGHKPATRQYISVGKEIWHSVRTEGSFSGSGYGYWRHFKSMSVWSSDYEF